MTSRGKKIFIALSIIIPFGIYSIVYYQEKFRYANFKAKDFISFEYQWGIKDPLENSYSTVSHVYRYHDNKDSVVTKKLALTKKDYKYLDSIADLQGFWNLPPILANSEADFNNPQILRYRLTFVYKNDTKTVTFLSNYDRNDKMRNVAMQMRKEVDQLLVEAEQKANN